MELLMLILAVLWFSLVILAGIILNSLDKIEYDVRQIHRRLDEVAPIPVGEIVEEDADPADWWRRGIKE